MCEIFIWYNVNGSIVIKCNILCGERATVVSWDVKLGLSFESYITNKSRFPCLLQ